jgi:hypothetical protein
MPTALVTSRRDETALDQALLDFPAAQQYLGGLSRSTLKLHVWRGLLRPTRIGKRVFFQRAELDRFIAVCTESPLSNADARAVASAE